MLTGTLPLAAAASMSDWGQTWWRKHIGWLAAWLLYKPAAALLYVAAFRLAQGKALTGVLSGFMLLILAVLILPALLRVIVPATAHLGASSGGHLAMAAAGALATGAIRAGLHKPPMPTIKENPSTPDSNHGPSGATNPPSGSSPPSSSPERRWQDPPASPSSGDGGEFSDERPSRTRRARAAAATLAAGLSANNASWRSKDDQGNRQRTQRSADGRPANWRKPGT